MAHHGLVIVAGWALFAWGWHRVLARGTDFTELRWLMLGAAVVVPVITISWILHNRGIHRRKGARRRTPEATLSYRTDFHGREVIADFGVLADAQLVEISLEGSHKRYSLGRPVGGTTSAPTGLSNENALMARSLIDHASHAHNPVHEGSAALAPASSLAGADAESRAAVGAAQPLLPELSAPAEPVTHAAPPPRGGPTA